MCTEGQWWHLVPVCITKAWQSISKEQRLAEGISESLSHDLLATALTLTAERAKRQPPSLLLPSQTNHPEKPFWKQMWAQ